MFARRPPQPPSLVQLSLETIASDEVLLCLGIDFHAVEITAERGIPADRIVAVLQIAPQTLVSVVPAKFRVLYRLA